MFRLPDKRGVDLISAWKTKLLFQSEANIMASLLGRSGLMFRPTLYLWAPRQTHVAASTE